MHSKIQLSTIPNHATEPFLIVPTKPFQIMPTIPRVGPEHATTSDNYT